MEAHSVTELLIEFIAEETGTRPDVVTCATSLADLGVDSLEFVELIQSIERKFKAIIPREKWGSLDTVGDIAKALA